jgi:hypothetical protein
MSTNTNTSTSMNRDKTAMHTRVARALQALHGSLSRFTVLIERRRALLAART